MTMPPIPKETDSDEEFMTKAIAFEEAAVAKKAELEKLQWKTYWGIHPMFKIIPILVGSVCDNWTEATA